jgi:Fe-S-cluster containining protein
MARASRSRPSGRPGQARAALLDHVRRVQVEIRTCAGCGLCCTAAHNTAQILPVEAHRIAEHLRGLAAPRRAALHHRLQRAVREFGLGPGGPPRHYTCAFLEPDARCALPLEVKPTLCLSFNPRTPDSCDQEPTWFHEAHDHEVAENRRRGLPMQRSAIPAAVLAALGASPPGSSRASQVSPRPKRGQAPPRWRPRSTSP